MHNQRGFAHLVLLLLLVVGLVLGVYLVGKTQIFKSRAGGGPIVLKEVATNTGLPSTNGVYETTSPQLLVELYSPLGPNYNGISHPISGPLATYTVGFKIGEDPASLASSMVYSYHSDPMLIGYLFNNTSYGSKFIMVEFIASDGSRDTRTVQVNYQQPAAQATVTVSPDTVSADGSLTVTWSGIPNPSLSDVINLTSADGTIGVGMHSFWIHNNCTWLTPSTGTPQSSGSCNLNIATEFLAPGTYKASLYSGATQNFALMAWSNLFTVGSAPVATPTPSPVSTPTATPTSSPTPSPSVAPIGGGVVPVPAAPVPQPLPSVPAPAADPNPISLIPIIGPILAPEPVPSSSPQPLLSDSCTANSAPQCIGTTLSNGKNATCYKGVTPVSDVCIQSCGLCTPNSSTATGGTTTPTPSQSAASCPAGTVRQEAIGYEANGINTYCWGANGVYLGGILVKNPSSGGTTGGAVTPAPTCTYAGDNKTQGVCGTGSRNAPGYDCSKASDYGLGNAGCTSAYPSCYVGCTKL